MSRVRVVKGTYTKISEGNHHMFAEGSIISSASENINQLGTDKGVGHGSPNKVANNEEKEFNITFSLNRDERTVVPLGILDFDNKYENPYFAFNYSLSLSNIETLNIEIKDAEGHVIYQMLNIEPVVITATKKTLVKNQIDKNLPLFPIKSWNYLSAFESYKLSSPDYTKIGSYILYWDGFDNNGIYDSTRFNDKTLKAKITATKGDQQKSLEIEFSTALSDQKLNWVDVKIDKINQKIYTTLRVELEDGGEEGLKCSTVDMDPDPKSYLPTTVCPWDKIPKAELAKYKQTPIKARTRSFSDLEQLAIKGLNYHWGRNEHHAVAKDVKVGSDSYKLYMNAISTKQKAMGAMKLIYNTNGEWMRSGNPGTVEGPLSAGGNVFSRQAICYNSGYIYTFDILEFYKGRSWGFRLDTNEDIVFMETSAHEIGHEILKQYGGTVYSYGHKGVVNPVFQWENSNAVKNPTSGEIDLMPYFTDGLAYSQRKRIAAAEKDALSLIWLTKITIK